MKILRYTLLPPVLVATAHATQFLTIEQAQRVLFPSATLFVERKLVLTEHQVQQIEKRARSQLRLQRQRLWQAVGQQRQLGFVFVDEVYGKHEFITYALALDPAGTVLGVEILDYRESYGGEIRNPAWRAQFTGKTANDSMELDRDVRNISGATLSCQHVTEGIRRILALFDVALRAN